MQAAFVMRGRRQRRDRSPSEAPRRFSGGALRTVRRGEVLSSVIGSLAQTESKF
jgi:hypothetical protein